MNEHVPAADGPRRPPRATWTGLDDRTSQLVVALMAALIQLEVREVELEDDAVAVALGMIPVLHVDQVKRRARVILMTQEDAARDAIERQASN